MGNSAGAKHQYGLGLFDCSRRSSFTRSVAGGSVALLALLALLAAIGACAPEATDNQGFTQSALTATPAFVQMNSADPQATQSSVASSFTGAQTAGDLNVVIVGWNNATAAITAVTDSRGNVYALAVGPTKRTTTNTQSIYYAKNIVAAAAGANTVTVTFGAAAPFPDLRILEYSGIDPVNALDVTVAAVGTAVTCNSGAVTTTSAVDLLVAGNYILTHTTGAGTGFTSRVITSPDGDIAEDRVVTAVGSVSATATLSATGGWVMQMAAFRAAVLNGDTQPPTAPTNLGATAQSLSQITLSWTAATDNTAVTSYRVERCQGVGCSTFIQIGTSSTTTFNDPGLAPATSYTYQVRAADAAGNLGPYSAVASATTPADTQAPTAPASLTATAVSASQINLAWTAATDNLAVTSYAIERCQGAACTSFAAAGSATGLMFSDTGLAAGTSFSYRVHAVDAANNQGAPSPVASATTPAPDTTPPSAPSNLVATAISSSQINLAWTAATDNVAVTTYSIERCQGTGCTTFAVAGASTAATFNDTGRTGATSYSYRVRAGDAAGNLGAYSNTASATTQTAPTVPTFVQVASANPQSSPTSLAVTYAAAQTAGDLNVVIVGWDDTTKQIASVTDTKGNVYTRAIGPTTLGTNVAQSIYYANNIATAAAAGNAVTVTFNAATPFPDVRILEYRGIDPVSALDGASAGTGSNATCDSGLLTTTSPTDLLVGGNYILTHTNGAGTGFTSRVITNPDGDIAEDRVVTAAGAYNATAPLANAGGWVMQMVAFRAAGGAPDTQAPTSPSNLSATAPSGNQITLTWTASTDNFAVTGYLIERCQGAGCSTFAQVGTSTGTTFGDSGLTPATGYSYRVRATDAASNLSGYSNVAGATTLAPDNEAPSAPSNLTASAASGTQINLSWSAATDNVGVTTYLIERCQGVGCSSFAQTATATGTSFSGTGLLSNTSYSFRVRASDAASNLGGYSNVASATTPNAPATPTFVQGNSTAPQTTPASLSLAFSNAQVAGDLNVVIVGWNDTTGQIASVSDSRGNPYVLAVGPTTSTGLASQSIYYARNIVAAGAGANSVTIAFSPAAQFPDLRILEYSGIDPVAAVDVAVGAAGTTATTDSGTAVTGNPNDLLVAGNYVMTHNTGAGAGFTSRIITNPDGDIAEDRVVTAQGAYNATAPLSAAGAWVMDMVAFRAAGSPAGVPDTTPPAVSITAPTSGAAVLGILTVNVSASDVGLGVASVQLLVDGVPVGPADTTAPYSFTLDTTQLTNDVHAIGAYALDFASNVGNATAVSVIVSNDTSQSGAWSGLKPLPIVPVHVSLLSTGKILMSDGQSAGFDARVWDTAANTFTSVFAPSNIFCSGHEQMADGRIIIVGGHNTAHVGLSNVNAFNPTTQAWSVLPDMSQPRWYPTPITLPDGREMVISGETNCDGCFVQIPEIYNPTTNAWSRLTSAPFSFSYYPHLYVLPDGRVIVPNTTESPITSQILDIAAQTWTATGGAAVDGGSSAMYLPGKIIKTGTSVDPDDAVRPAFPTAYVLDTTQASPTWRQVASMSFARTFHTMTMLPDGNVLVTGGGPTTAAVDTAHAVLNAEMWSPTTETWTMLAAMNAPRLYHSNALLMPDGRIMVSGGGRFDDVTLPTDQFNAEFYSPPYLFKGARPVISSAPATLTYGQSFTVQTPDAARIAKVSLIRYGSTTHAINMGQVFVPLSFTAGAGSLTVTAPVNSALARPGFYMLFIVDSNGIPSVAATTRM